MSRLVSGLYSNHGELVSYMKKIGFSPYGKDETGEGSFERWQYFSKGGKFLLVNFTQHGRKVKVVNSKWIKLKTNNPGTPKKGESTRNFQGRKYYYVGRTLYFNKMMQIKDRVRTMGAGVAVTKSKGKGFMIWSTQKVHIPLMEVGGDNLFMEGEYNPKNKGRFTWTCRFCGTKNFDNKLAGQVCEKCKRPIASWQKIGR